MKIQSKIFNYGNEKEADWPPQFGNRKGGFWYWCEKDNKMKEGFPPDPHPKLDTAPFVIADTIDAYYHPGAETWTDSKSKLKLLDKGTGCITTDKMLPADPSWRKENDKKRYKDMHDCLHKAVAQIDAGTAPLTEEMRAKCTLENERVSNLLGFDAFNVAGKKNDPRGKKYRRRK